MLRFLPRRLAFPLSLLPRAVAASVTEVRLRLNAPLSLSLNGRNLFVDEHGKVCRIESALRADEDDLRATLAEHYKAHGLCSALVLSPPAAGKTTFLRSIA